jgi:hypothetical protein
MWIKKYFFTTAAKVQFFFKLTIRLLLCYEVFFTKILLQIPFCSVPKYVQDNTYLFSL